MTDTDGSPVRCTATATTTEKRCRRIALPGAAYCSLHREQQDTPTEGDTEQPQTATPPR